MSAMDIAATGSAAPLEVIGGTSTSTDLVHTDPGALLEQLNNGDVDGFEIGLVEGRPPSANIAMWAALRGYPGQAVDFLAKANTYVQPRVESWGPNGVVEADIVKFQTMNGLTETGKVFMKELKALRDAGDVSLTTKAMGDWRIYSSFARLVRSFSGDEVAQLVYNVGGMTGAPSDNLLKMSTVGSSRPPLAEEIQTEGDGSNDLFCRALESVCPALGFNSEDWRDLFLATGEIYKPSLVNPNTSRGHRQLNTQKDYEQWLMSNWEWSNIQNLPPVRRALAVSRVVGGTAFHLLKRTNAQ